MRFFVSNKVIIIFIDGVGVGENSPEYNPCCYSRTGIFSLSTNTLPYDGKFYPIDAQLGVNGLPQSATGHTTLYTGINAARLISKHLYGFPNQALRDLLRKYSIFVRLKNQGYRCKFINAFRPVFFTTPEIFKNLHMSATTEMNRYCGFKFADFKQIKMGCALYHDYTNTEPREKGFNIPEFSAKKAAEILISQSELHNLILYEYFLTDFAGHSRDKKRAIAEIHKVENLIMSVLELMNFNTTCLVVVSDHGNIEDLRTKSHTKNPAFLAVWGPGIQLTNYNFSSLLDVCPYVFFAVTGQMPVHRIPYGD